MHNHHLSTNRVFIGERAAAWSSINCRANHIVARDQVISSHKALADKVWGGVRTVLKPASATPSCLNLGISLHNRGF